jgi:hypothetical protein
MAIFLTEPDNLALGSRYPQGPGAVVGLVSPSAFCLEEGMKDIPGYEGIYAITENGRVWSYQRKTTGRGGRPAVGQWIKQRFSRGGKYLSVALRAIGERRSRGHLVHRLVLTTYVGAPPHEASECNHLDGDKMNNVLGNLEWTTSSGNRKHAWSTGLIKETANRHEASFKRALTLRKLTGEQAREIRHRHSAGETQTDIADSYHVSRKTIYMIIKRITYAREE